MVSTTLSPLLPPLPPLHPHSPLRPLFLLPFPSPPRALVLRSASAVSHGAEDSSSTSSSSSLRRPLVSDPLPSFDDDGKAAEGRERKGGRMRRGDPEWVDWEDQILEDTVPLVGFVRMILHSGKYESGDRLSPEHEKAILERLLAHHPEAEKKIGCGIDFITIGYHPDFEGSRCLFIVRKDGELVDFSFWKCIKSLIRKKYPLYADSFILRHFRRKRNSL